MKQKHLRDQRGVAMLLELVLVAAVLVLAGLAVYQSSHRAAQSGTQTPSSAAVNSGAAPSSAVGLAATAAASSEQDSATDASLSASADSSATDVTQTNTDMTNLGDSSNASF
jgi:hypothetical protein